jgi:hypothetical protein
MATGQARNQRESELTAEQKARIEAVRANRRSPAAKAEESRIRAVVDQEYRKTGTLKTTGDGTQWASWCHFADSSCACVVSESDWGFP